VRELFDALAPAFAARVLTAGLIGESFLNLRAPR